MIKPGRYNITAYQGATYNLNLTWSTDSVPTDLTNYSSAMQVRVTPNASTAAVSLTNGTGITLGGTAGTIDVTIDATTMSGISAGQYVYDLELDSGETVYRLLQGTFQVEAEVTK